MPGMRLQKVLMWEDHYKRIKIDTRQLFASIANCHIELGVPTQYGSLSFPYLIIMHKTGFFLSVFYIFPVLIVYQFKISRTFNFHSILRVLGQLTSFSYFCNMADRE